MNTHTHGRWRTSLATLIFLFALLVGAMFAPSTAFAQTQAGVSWYAVDIGVANVYAVNMYPVPQSMATGMVCTFKVANTCTGSSTLNVQGLGAYTLKKPGNANVVSGDIVSGTVVSVVFDGTNWQITSALSTTTVGTITTGTWQATPIAIAYGGTGAATATNGFNALSPLTTLGDILYGASAGAGTRLAGNTSATKNFLISTGNGSVAAAPAWGTIAAGDVPTITHTKISDFDAQVLTTAAPAAGSSSIVTVGTVTAGTWNATPVTVPYGGTGRSSTTAYAVLAGGTTSTGAVQSIASVGTTGQVLTSNGAGALPTFQAGGATIGSAVIGAANNQLLYADNSGNLAQSAQIITDPTLIGGDPGNLPLVIGGGLIMQSWANNTEYSIGFNMYQNGTNYKAKRNGATAIILSDYGTNPNLQFGVGTNVSAGANSAMVYPLVMNQSTITASEPIAMGANKITGVLNPTAAQDAATKNYVDTVGSANAGTATASAGAATLNKAIGLVTSETLSTAALGSYTLTLTNSVATASSQVMAIAYRGTSTVGVPTIVSITPTSNQIVFVVSDNIAVGAFNGTICIQYNILNP